MTRQPKSVGWQQVMLTGNARDAEVIPPRAREVAFWEINVLGAAAPRRRIRTNRPLPRILRVARHSPGAADGASDRTSRLGGLS
jgi:hypothetical protein